MIPQPGKVSIQVSTISFATLQFTERTLFAAPTPIMAVVFAWVVETGKPVSEQTSKAMVAAMSAEKP